MALIICRMCGRYVSDTVKKCIHCGADISNTQHYVEQVAAYQNNLNNNINYDSLNEYHKSELESEFLNSNKDVYKYYRKIREVGTFIKISSTQLANYVLKSLTLENSFEYQMFIRKKLIVKTIIGIIYYLIDCIFYIVLINNVIVYSFSDWVVDFLSLFLDEYLWLFILIIIIGCVKEIHAIVSKKRENNFIDTFIRSNYPEYFDKYNRYIKNWIDFKNGIDKKYD